MSEQSPDTSLTTSGAAKGASNLALRVVAALVLAPLTILVAWLGGWFWLVLAVAAGALLYVEWLMILSVSRRQAVVPVGIAALVVAGPFLMKGRLDIAATIVVAGIGLLAIVARERPSWVMGGLGYAALAMIASVLVRQDPQFGFLALIFVLLIVWATDVGGYFAGRGLGGPKLWARVSPKKTWAGAIGGLVLSLIVAAAFAVLGYGKMAPLLSLAGVLSIASQLGDLFESALKRRFGVKDSSHLIPGHGGLLDRLDGFVAAIVVAALIGYLRGGLGGVGRGFMVW